MIHLHRTQTPGGEVAVTLDRATGRVSYRKGGMVRALVDNKGHNLSRFVTKAVSLLTRDDVSRVLVLGHGGGAASSLLYKGGMDVVSVDCDICAGGLGRLFFRVPPSLAVTVEDAATYVANAPPASFDAVLVDFQDTATTPVAYLSGKFWTGVVTVLRPPAMIVTHVTGALQSGSDWPIFRRVLASVGLDSIALSEPFSDGDRLLLSLCST